MLKQTLHFCFIILVASAIGCGSKSSTDNGSNGDGVSGNDVAVDVRADWIPDDVTADQSGGLDQLAGEDQLQQDTVGGEDQSVADDLGKDGTQGDDVVVDTAKPECALPTDCAAILGTLGQCQEAACTEGTCVAVPKKKGESCDDGDGCTVVDECDDNGKCVGVTNPCVDSSNPCKQEANSACVSTGSASYACSYDKNVADKVACDDQNVCTITDLCGADGTCVGTPQLGGPCKPTDGDYGICGQYGDCAPIQMQVPVNTGQIDYTLLALCQPPNDKPYAFLSEHVVKDLKVTSREIDLAAPNTPFGSPELSIQWTPTSLVAEARVTCSREHALVLEGQRDEHPTTTKTLLRKVDTTWEPRPTFKIAAESVVNWNYGGEIVNNLVLERIEGILTRPGTVNPQIYLYGHFLDPEPQVLGNLNAYLIVCDEKSGDFISYACSKRDINNVGSDSSSHVTLGLHGSFHESGTLLWALMANFNATQVSPWFMNGYIGALGSWSANPPLGAPGAYLDDLFFSTLVPLDRLSGYSRRSGYYGVDGFDDLLVVAIGDPLPPLFRTDLPVTKPLQSIIQGRVLAYRRLSSGFELAPEVPTENLLVPSSGAPTPVVREYVFRHVRVLDSATAVIVGYELSCSETSKDDCFLTDAIVQMRLRPFVIFFRPLESQLKQWGNMVPLEDGLTYTCCNRVAGMCGNTPPCGAWDFWESYPRAVAVNRDASGLSLVVGANWAVAPNGTAKTPRIWWVRLPNP